MNVTSRLPIVAILTATASCGALLGLEEPFDDPSLSPASSSNPDAADTSAPVIDTPDSGIEDAARPVQPDRVECRKSSLLGLGVAETLAPFPLFDGGQSHFFGIAVDEQSEDDVTAYVNVSNDYSAGLGRLYRVRNGSPDYEVFVDPSTAGGVKRSGRHLFVSSQSGSAGSVTRYPLDCASPCTAGERVTPESFPPIDAFWPASSDTVYIVPYLGDLYRATRTATGWAGDSVGPITAPGSYRSAAATSQVLYVAQAGTLFLQPFPIVADLAGLPQPVMPADAGGALLLADCDHVYGMSEFATLSFDPATAQGTEIGAGSSLYGSAIDENFLYVGYPNQGGLVRFRKDQRGPREPLAPYKSVWGLAASTHWIYYADHGDSLNAVGTLYRRRKIAR